MAVAVREIAQELSMSEEEVHREGVRALLVDRLRLFDVERRARCARFGVNSLEEMDELIREGKVEEADILEDFQHVDYLTARIERIEELLERL